MKSLIKGFSRNLIRLANFSITGPLKSNFVVILALTFLNLFGASTTKAVPTPTPVPNLSLSTTYKEAPALQARNVNWDLYRLHVTTNHSQYRHFDSYRNRHSLAIYVPSGRYMAMVTASVPVYDRRGRLSWVSINRQRVFDVSYRTMNTIVISLDP